jgi:hypothetical protein
MLYPFEGSNLIKSLSLVIWPSVTFVTPLKALLGYSSLSFSLTVLVPANEHVLVSCQQLRQITDSFACPGNVHHLHLLIYMPTVEDQVHSNTKKNAMNGT